MQFTKGLHCSYRALAWLSLLKKAGVTKSMNNSQFDYRTIAEAVLINQEREWPVLDQRSHSTTSRDGTLLLALLGSLSRRMIYRKSMRIRILDRPQQSGKLLTELRINKTCSSRGQSGERQSVRSVSRPGWAASAFSASGTPQMVLQRCDYSL